MNTLTKATARSHKYLRLAKHFRDQIQSGALKPGERLPSFAQMQAEHGIGQGTLERAYALLEEERIIVREASRGTFVAEPRIRASLGVVGVATGRSPREYPYYLHLLEGMQDVAFEEKIEILLLHDVSSPKWEKMDGVISTGQAIRIPPTMPAVTLIKQGEAGACVMADDYGGSKAATEHLISLGHHRIGFLILGGNKSIDSIINRRLDGYRDALREAGIEPKPKWVRPLRDAWEAMRPFADLGHDKMAEWLQEDWSQLGCTAILAHNDYTAMGMIRAFKEAGIDVPREVSVVGFDGTEVADLSGPKLTTVVVPLYEIGATGMRRLLEQIHGRGEQIAGEAAPQMEILQTRLKIQDSSAEWVGK